MSFNSLKSQHGTRIMQAVAIYPNACKYSVDDALAKGVIQAPAITASQTGNITISGGDALFFITSTPYLKFDNELMKVAIVDATTINIISRGQFGTTAVQHASGNATIKHGGEADGSCRGYPRRPDGKGCSTADSFDRDVTREFLITNTQLVFGEVYYNGLDSITHSPTLLKPGKEMAKNASVNVSITDSEDGDVYSVPYPSARTNNSTWARKLVARTGGYLRNRKMITYTGFSEGNAFDRDNMIAREYIIDSFDISNGNNVSIKGLDPLMLAEESKAKAPAVSAGNLAVAIDELSTQIQMKDFIVGEYGNDTESGTVIIDSEYIDYTVNDSSLGLLDIVARGVAGSEQKNHSLNATVQWVLTFENFNPVSVIIGLLQNYTNIESRFFGDYTSAINAAPTNLGKVYIRKPESVKTLINEIIESWAENNIALYYDEVAALIRVKVVGDFQQQPITITDIDIEDDSPDIENDYEGQITRATIGFAPFDASKKVDDENASIIYQSVNIAVENSGTLEPQEADEFYTRFLTSSDTDVSIAVGGIGRIANINVKPPQTIKFNLDYEMFGAITGGVIEEGEIINVTTANNIDDDGLPASQNVQILSVKDNPAKATITITAETFQDIVNSDDFDFIISENKENYVLSDEYAPTEAGEYIVFIASSVTIGATQVGNFAFSTGNQADGVTFKLVHRGSILGAGGKGASGPIAVAPSPQVFPNQFIEVEGNDGFDGGDAMELTVPTVIDTSQGVILSGGGGAPSYSSIASTRTNNTYVRGGDGGSGGQGYVGGLAGVGGEATILGSSGQMDIGKDGINGSRSAPGVLGSISAGAWGEESDTGTSTGLAGQPGYAIKSNGNSVTIIGDNAATIRGLRDF